jgi:hypothetical protein
MYPATRPLLHRQADWITLDPDGTAVVVMREPYIGSVD